MGTTEASVTTTRTPVNARRALPVAAPSLFLIGVILGSPAACGGNRPFNLHRRAGAAGPNGDAIARYGLVRGRFRRPAPTRAPQSAPDLECRRALLTSRRRRRRARIRSPGTRPRHGERFSAGGRGLLTLSPRTRITRTKWARSRSSPSGSGSSSRTRSTGQRRRLPASRHRRLTCRSASAERRALDGQLSPTPGDVDHDHAERQRNVPRGGHDLRRDLSRVSHSYDSSDQRTG